MKKRTEHLGIRVPAKLKDKLVKRADRKDITLSTLVIELLESGL